ncbi:branched-chain amino acid ABC transporter substrate-binding protein [Rhizobium sp. TH2]|uniref:branched-chain amino acid ABC transporter substrate-binding protein n=1 Tax=Rhizobium sp. TH2 TaxID=2775403 RepID=UPI0021584DBB|nr:branched-chain amino acid ABC transporter substrate-binding protein [Rhizobium sp. TH2]UVC11398.1 branched-chain amino acid ABC transporter substrate-binding protein [Rhizobium sp. TH2]
MTMKLRSALACLLLAAAPQAGFAAGPRIAVVAPMSGNLQVLGDQIRLGAVQAADGKAEIITIDETCTEKSAPSIAEQIRQADAVAAIGFLCVDSLDGGLPILAETKIPAITLSVRSPVLMEDSLKKGWPFFRLAPSTSAERDMIVQEIFAQWKDKPFALLDDGTIMSREMIDNVRQALEQKGMKAAFIDNFRPAQEVQTQLIRRLAKAGITHVFAASDRNDMSVMARDAKAAKINLTFMGGDALNGTNQPVPLEPGTFAVTLPDPQTIASAKPIVEIIHQKKKSAEGYVLPSYSAITVILEANEIASGSGAPLADALSNTPFETPIGEIRFNKNHELSTNPFRMLVWDGNAFVLPPVTE